MLTMNTDYCEHYNEPGRLMSKRISGRPIDAACEQKYRRVAAEPALKTPQPGTNRTPRRRPADKPTVRR